MQASALQLAGGTHGPKHAVGAPAVGEGGLSCDWGNRWREHEMQHCQELCRANRTEERMGERGAVGEVREKMEVKQTWLPLRVQPLLLERCMQCEEKQGPEMPRVNQ